MEKKNIIVSACLLGVPCRYDGKSKPCERVKALLDKYNLIPACPEVFGGLSTPRPPSERVGERVINSLGCDVTENYKKGALAVLDLCRLYSADTAILKAKSPVCAHGELYDGSFTRTLRSGDGVLSELLIECGISVFSEEDFEGEI